ncbi:flagellar export protein FliJ [Methylobacter sp. BBA5.1]|uniref:flagellar export protein FliJ n=1 Tax=Methylobacter sp. BBA5.1 TaxID=1495064 RepID=UPI00056D5DD1|nr:flagellar export protein FliJ [Methylobacter sp. BBA5.1]
MKRSQRIQTIVEIKASQEKNSLEVLGAVQRKKAELQAQLDNLKQYRQEYQERFDRLGGGGVKVAQLLEFRSFIEKLDKAIAGQEQAMRAMDADLAAKRKVWESAHQQTNSLRKVCDSALQTETRQAGKLEQVAQDEWASRFFQSSSGGAKNA